MFKLPIIINTNKALGDNLYSLPIVEELLKNNRHIFIFTYTGFLYANLKKVTVLNRSNFFIRNFIKYFVRFFCTEIKLRYPNNERILDSYFKCANLIKPEKLDYPNLPDDLVKVSNIQIQKNTILFNISAGHGIVHRQVYGINWEQIITELQSKGYTCYEIGLKSNIKNCELLATTQIEDLFGAIKQSSFFIGLDSGPSHIAACYRVPSLIFMGPVNPELRHFNTFKGLLLKNDCEYSNCFHETKNPTGKSCVFINETKEHQCCTFSTKNVILSIEKLIEKYEEKK